MNTYFTFVFPWAFLALFGAIFMVGVRNIILGYRSRRWPQVPGVIRESSAVSVYSDSDGPSFDARLSYEYSVDGISYSGSNIDFGSNFLASGNRTQKLLTRFPVGQNVIVFHHPTDARKSVLIPGPSDGATFTAGAGLAFMIIVSMIYFLFM